MTGGGAVRHAGLMDRSTALSVWLTVMITLAVGIFFAVMRRAARDIRDTNRVLQMRWRQFWRALAGLAFLGFLLAALLVAATRVLVGTESPPPDPATTHQPSPRR